MKDGRTKDFLKRYLICRDYFWWQKEGSPFRLNEVHPWVEKMRDPFTGEMVEPIGVNFWRDQVLELCSYEITHQCFGLSYNDLMNCDTVEFAAIKDKVMEIAKQKTEMTQKIDEKASGKSANNILKGITK